MQFSAGRRFGKRMDPHKPLVFVLVVASLAFVESTRNDETLRRSGFPVRPGSPRRRRSESYRDGTVVTKTAGDSSNAEVVILNGYTSDDEMTIDFQQHRFKLRYGDFQKASFRITGGEKFVVRVRNGELLVLKIEASLKGLSITGFLLLFPGLFFYSRYS